MSSIFYFWLANAKLEPMRLTILSLFVFSSFALADMTCQDLVDSIELAFDRADSMVMEVWLEQTVFEIGYTKLQLFKNGDKWESRVLEKRGAQHQKKEKQSAEPDIGFDCADNDSEITVSKTQQGWELVVKEAKPEKKVYEWVLDFKDDNGILFPTKVIAKFQISVLAIPINGQAITILSDWRLP